MKKHKHLIILLFLLFTTILVLSACNEKTPKTIRGACGEDFEMFLVDQKLNKLTDDIVKCSVKVVFERENDITNKSSYHSQRFEKYSYSVSIKGTIDAKYAGRKVSLAIVFVPEYHYGAWSNTAIISENGTFSCSYTHTSNAIITEWIPNTIVLH